MARARVKPRRDIKTPVKGLFTIVLLAFAFVLFCEVLIGLIRFVVG